jgi:hypothetical protein
MVLLGALAALLSFLVRRWLLPILLFGFAVTVWIALFVAYLGWTT